MIDKCVPLPSASNTELRVLRAGRKMFSIQKPGFYRESVLRKRENPLMLGKSSYTDTKVIHSKHNDSDSLCTCLVIIPQCSHVGFPTMNTKCK